MSNDTKAPLEAVYLVDQKALVHLMETQHGFAYDVFDNETKQRQYVGNINWETILESGGAGLLAAARIAVFEEVGLAGTVVMEVGLTTLSECMQSDVRRRRLWEQDSLPKDDIRVIDSSYNTKFKLPNGGSIEVEYPANKYAEICEYVDDYHTRIAGHVFHICQFAELVERNNGIIRPEPLMEDDQAAWQLGHSGGYLVIRRDEDSWHYTLYDSSLNLRDEGILTGQERTMNEVRNQIILEHKLEYYHIYQEDYALVVEAADMVEDQAADRKHSVLADLDGAQIPPVKKKAQDREMMER